MQRNTGALASLTATYDSGDDSDASDDDGTNSRVLPGVPRVVGPAAAIVPAPFLQATDDFFSTNIHKDTNYDTESGHITDEDLDSGSDKEDFEIIREGGANAPIVPALNLREMAPTIGDVTIPPEPPGRASNHLQEKFAQYYEKMLRDRLDMNTVIQKQKKFRNPSIYEKLIQYCQIDELGTNYTPDIYDPKQFGPMSYYEELAKAQKIEMDKRQKEQKERTRVEFISGTVRKPPSGDLSASEEKKRKSKWDVGAGAASKPTTSATSSGPATVAVIPPPGLVAPINTATKAMVISAYGTITKKMKQ